MPLYEYACEKCDTRFDALRAMKDADTPIACPDCGSQETSRMLSLFFAMSRSEGAIAGQGSSCGSCTPSGSCASCASRH